MKPAEGHEAIQASGGANRAPGTEGAGLPLDEIAARIEEEYPSLELLYRHLHAHPELSGQEEKTSERMAEELARAQFEVATRVGGFGVVGLLRNGQGPTVMVRADVDALPIKEQTGLPYASQVETVDAEGRTVGVMHACGHDAHMTMLAGAARILHALRQHWSGTLLMIAQPAEERLSGARRMIEDGLFTRFPRPDCALALHVDPELRAGQIGYTKGYAMASAQALDITVRGVGGHGARPEQAKDPIVLAAQLILALQTIVSREIAPQEPAVITVGSIHGGSRPNVIPDEVKLQATIRSFSGAVEEQVKSAIVRTARALAAAAGMPEQLAPVIRWSEEHTPSVYNSPELAERVAAAFRRAVGPENVREKGPVMGSEDFGLYGRVDPPIPILLFRLGAAPAKPPSETSPPGLHSPFFAPDLKPTLQTGLKAMSAAVLDLFRNSMPLPRIRS